MNAGPLALAAAIALALLATPRAARAQQTPAAIFGYDLEHGAYIRTRDGSYELNPYAMVQLQNVTEFPSGGAGTTSFVLRAAKFILHGHVLDRSLTYHFQLNAGDGRVVAEDVYLQWDAGPWLTLLAGQIEVPYNRQHITLEAYQQFVERSSVDRRFNLARDLGAAVYLHTPGRVLETAVGVWNGSRQNVVNDDPSYMVTARVAWNPWGPVPFREGDVQHSTHPRFSLALAGAYNPRRIVADDAHPEQTVTTREIAQAVLDATLRYRGLSLTAEVHARRRLLENNRVSVDRGVLLQAGMFLLPRHFELVARYGAISGDLAARDAATEVSGGANYYFHGHRFKLQSDYAWLVARDGSSDHRFRLQLEFFL